MGQPIIKTCATFTRRPGRDHNRAYGAVCVAEISAQCTARTVLSLLWACRVRWVTPTFSTTRSLHRNHDSYRRDVQSCKRRPGRVHAPAASRGHQVRPSRHIPCLSTFLMPCGLLFFQILDGARAEGRRACVHRPGVCLPVSGSLDLQHQACRVSWQETQFHVSVVACDAVRIPPHAWLHRLKTGFADQLTKRDNKALAVSFAGRLRLWVARGRVA